MLHHTIIDGRSLPSPLSILHTHTLDHSSPPTPTSLHTTHQGLTADIIILLDEFVCVCVCLIFYYGYYLCVFPPYPPLSQTNVHLPCCPIGDRWRHSGEGTVIICFLLIALLPHNTQGS